MYRLNEFHQFEIDGVVVEGKILGVNSIGKLIVEVDNSKKEYDMKNIKYII
jgi:hypothetical protein